GFAPRGIAPRRSPTFELGLPLFDEGLHALARVLALEDPDERLTLDRETFREGAAVALDRGDLDLAHGVARALGVGPRALAGDRLQLGGRHQLVHDARVLRGLRRKRHAA